MPSTRNLRYELLCPHHNLDNFHSGEDGHDASLRFYQQQIRELDSDRFIALVAAEQSGDVAGAMVMVDVRLRADGDGEQSPPRLGFLYALWLVRQDYQGTMLAKRLVSEAYKIRQRRYRLYPYVGDLAEPGDDDRLKATLSDLGFAPLSGWGYFWFRPKDWNRGGST